MTKRDQLLARLREPLTDQEIAHSLAENALVEYLREVGYDELADAWLHAEDIQGWWYA